MTSSLSYKQIKKNIYSGLKNVPRSDVYHAKCVCPEGPSKCSTNECVNRVIFVECSETCGPRCMNRRIQNNECALGLQRVLTNDKGYGIFTKSLIKKGDFILEYVGEILMETDFEERMRTVYKNDIHHYCLQLHGNLVIDGKMFGGEARFVNHSCQPNCEMQKWSVNGLPTMALFALRDIDPGEELTYDYKFTLFGGSEGQACFCGSKDCRGVIGIPKKDRKNLSACGGNWNDPQISSNQHFIGGQGFTVRHNLDDLSVKTKDFVRKHMCFLTRNYEKIVKTRRDLQDKAAIWNKLEKIMLAWSGRYRKGTLLKESYHNHECGSSFSAISQIICELFVNLCMAKDEKGIVLCQPFVTFQYRRNRHHQYSSSETHLDLYQIGKKILNSEYQSLTNFDEDLETVLTAFATVSTQDNPGIFENIKKIKVLYSTLKTKAARHVKCFVSHQSDRDSVVQADLPPFKNIPIDPVVNNVIRCICDRYYKENLMIQCEKCRVWQHGDCMQVSHSLLQDRIGEQGNEERGNEQRGKYSASVGSIINYDTAQSSNDPYLYVREEEVLLDGIVVNIFEPLSMLDMEHGSEVPDQVLSEMGSDEITDCQEPIIPVPEKENIEDEGSGTNRRINYEPYYCHLCQPRSVNREVCVYNGDNSDPNKVEFKTLIREDGFLICKNDTVYILRDPLYVNSVANTFRPIAQKDCDILRVETLFVHSNGSKFVYGRLYVRPNETYHEHDRRFFRNEICFSPINKLFPINQIHGRCWVLDPSTYCKGRPVGCEEEHLYICGYEVDRLKRKFSKINTLSHTECIKPFAFNYFEQKIRIKRIHFVSPLCI